MRLLLWPHRGHRYQLWTRGTRKLAFGDVVVRASCTQPCRSCFPPHCDLAMPVLPGESLVQREKVPDVDAPWTLYSRAARDMRKDERLSKPEAESPGVWHAKPRGCWGEENPREYREVAAEQKACGTAAHFGRLLGIFVDKTYHTQKRAPGWMFKGRAFYLGNSAKCQDGN